MLLQLSSSLTPQFLWAVVAFSLAIGACIGSFLNVVIYRLPLGIGLGNPRRSFCPLCKYQIPIWYNIPLLGWLLLRGKCGNCKEPISIRYLTVELLTGLLFVAVSMHCCSAGENPFLIVPYWILLSLFVAGLYIDLDHFILPDEITLGGAAVGLICSAVVPSFLGYDVWWQNLAASAAGAAVGYLLLRAVVELGKKMFGKRKAIFDPPVAWSIGQQDECEEPVFTLDGEASGWSDMFYRPKDRLCIECPEVSIDGGAHQNVTLTIKVDGVTVQSADDTQPALEIDLEHVQHLQGTCASAVIPREAMGLGDVKFMALVGAFLGWKGVLFTVFAASMIGSVLALLLIVLRRREWAQLIPFGPYLALGATLYLFYGAEILEWYKHLAVPQ